ncbi:DUF3991 domain-containing protein, partial [Roseovarius sp. SYSU LYC5161]|uniref:DUF3991 domain-containing protein n=1 Tax=Roseovarius halophilus (ex Wu et al. 2025) TaxID=3376060 RepID=UPI00399A39F0
AADGAAAAERQTRDTVQRAHRTRPPFTPPTPDPDAWPQVRAHLVDERGLDPDLVDEAHAAGDVYAQTREGEHGAMTNAVFLQRGPSGRPTGAEIKGLHQRRDGSRFSGMAAGSRKDRGAFRAGVDLAAARVVVVVEAAIDALSALMFARSKGRGDGVCVVSTAGEPKQGMPEPVMAAIPADATRVAAQDRNKVGDRQARQLLKLDSDHAWKRWTPPEPHTDWNDWAQTYSTETRGGDGSDTSPGEGPEDPFAPDAAPDLS